MCLEGVLLYFTLPVLGPFAYLINIILLLIALFFAIRTQNIIHIIGAYCCPLAYLIYYFAMNLSKKKNSKPGDDSDI